MAFSQVQTGTGTVSASASSGTATISAVTTTSTILMVQATVVGTSPQETSVGYELTNSTTITVYRNSAAGNAITFRYWVIEFSSGVTVQHGSTALSSTTNNITVNSVGSTSSAFAICSIKQTGTVYDGGDTIAFQHTTTTNLQVTAQSTPGTNVCYWQSIAYTGASVQRSFLSFNTTDTTKTDSTLTAVTLARTFVICGASVAGASSDMGAMTFDANMASTTSVTANRDHANGNAATVILQIVELPAADIQQVEQVSFTMAAGTAVDAPTLSTTLTDTSKAVIWMAGTHSCYGQTSKASNDDPSFASVTTSIDGDTLVSATRESSTAETYAGTGFVIEFKTSTGVPGMIPEQFALQPLTGIY